MGIMNSKSRSPNILVMGYYGRQNFGDDSFVRVLKKYMVANEVTVTFSNVESATKEMVRNADLIVLGGGDLLQSYFVKRLERLVFPQKTCPIYAVGVSIPYPNIIAEGGLDIIDRFWCRFDTDVKLLTARFPKYVQKLPDLALAHKVPDWKPRKRYIGLCLARSMVQDNETILVRQVSKLVQQLHSRGWRVNWLAFNDDDAEHESDVAFYKMLPEVARKRMPLYRGRNLLTVMSFQSVIVAARFHANVYAHMIGIPVVPLELTKKVHEWNVERGIEGVALPRICDCAGNCESCRAFMGTVRELPLETILHRIDTAVAPNSNFSHDHVNIGVTLGQIAELDYMHRRCPPYAVDRDAMRDQAVDVYFRYLRKDFTRDMFARILCAIVTGDPDHAFRYGLSQVVDSHNFDLVNAINYMINTHALTPQWNKSIWSHDDGVFCLSRTWQPRYEGVHRAGWATVLNSLKHLHNDRAPIMDTFLDRTFGWHAHELEMAGALPYREPWMGFIHHPPHAVKGENDCAHMVDREVFRKSLQHCVALFVFSTDLRKWLLKQAQREGLARLAKIPIHVVYHPTDFCTVRFMWSTFNANQTPYLVQVGAWCRDPGAIFRIRSPLAKAALMTSDMTDYMKFNSGDGACRTDVDMPLLTPEQVDSVRVIPHLSNPDYDELLSRNIVFLPLKQAVACNTLLECISRHTPVLVPRLPAVVEYIGDKYPMLYDNYEHAERLLQNRDILWQAHEYLRTFNADRLTHPYFCNSIRAALEPKKRKLPRRS
jgi:hypothetical protein